MSIVQGVALEVGGKGGEPMFHTLLWILLVIIIIAVILGVARRGL